VYTSTDERGLREALASTLEALKDGSLSAAAFRDLARLCEGALDELVQLRQLVEHIPAVLYIDEMTEPRTGAYPTIYVGPQLESILGVTPAEWTGSDDVWRERMHPDDWDAVSKEYAEYLQRGGVLVQEYRFVRPDNGRLVWVRDDCYMTIDPASGSRILLGVMFDITAQKVLEDQLRAAEAKNLALIEHIPSIVWIEPLNDNPESAFVSAAVEPVFGVDRDSWLDGNWWERHLHPDDRERVLALRQAAASSITPRRIEYRMTTAAGLEIWIGEVTQVVMNHGRPWVLQGLLDDITARKQAEQRLQFRASHDPLTGLANRPLFEESLEQALARARRNDLEVAVLFVDLDGFKQVNDAYGHDAGDEVLRIVTERLLQSARESDIVARRGGDEFLVLLPDIEGGGEDHREGAHRGVEVADVIEQRILKLMELPIQLSTGPVKVSLSIGRCVYPWDAADAKTMMAVADATMYGAKQDR
jgi:diguanylate cyclase (GGDEF)-like protein/PAS domain S-box-containing protein